MRTHASPENPYAPRGTVDLPAESTIASFKRVNQVFIFLCSIVSVWCIPCGIAIAAMLGAMMPGWPSVASIPGQLLGGVLVTGASAGTTFLAASTLQLSPGWWPATTALSVLLLILSMIGMRIWIQRTAPEQSPLQEFPVHG